MGKINRILKRLFISFNTLFAILGCLMIIGAMKSSAYSHELSEVSSLVWIWLFAIGVLCISCLGIYAGYSEKELILKIFAGFMVVGMIIMLIFGIITVVRRNKMKSSIVSTESIMKDEELRTSLNVIQQSFQCCGMVSASDWGDNIPNSCECSSGSECKSKPQGVSGPDRIYAQPCSQILKSWIDSVFSVAIGVCFGFAVTALLGLLISILMIHQIRRHDSSGGTSIAMRGY